MPRRGRTPGPREAAEDPEALARRICLRLLTIAPRTRAQLAQALQRRGVPVGAAEAVLARFTDAGLVDDAAFARAWVESRHHSRGLSRRSLSAELRQRGVGSDDITEAVDALDPEQEVATARRLVEQKMARTRGQPTEARARRAAGALARKGYPPGLAFRLVKEALDGEGPAGAIGFDPDADADAGFVGDLDIGSGGDLDAHSGTDADSGTDAGLPGWRASLPPFVRRRAVRGGQRRFA